MNAEIRSQPGNDLLDAYLATTYRVILDDGPEDVRIGWTHPGLDRKTSARCWAIITAFNPGSRRLPDKANRQRHVRLQDRVEVAGLGCWSTRHIAADGRWPEEEGLLLADVDDQWLHEQAREFGQLGVIHGHRRAPAELWLYADVSPRSDHPHVKVVH